MTTSGVELDRAGPVATVTLRRPDVLNAQTPEMWLALRDIGRELPGDVRVVVLRGEGRSFSSGLDISGGAPSFLAEITSLAPDAAAERIRPYQEGFTWLHRPDLISVAAVQGHAIGAGLQLALACDLRVLASDARLTMAEITLGLVPDLGGTKRLVELVGYARALELCLTARRVGAEEALQLGLAAVVVPLADLDSAVADLVAAVLAAPRDAVVETKALLAGAASRSWPEQLDAERDAQVRRLRDLAGLGE
ncbi:enoyl-CoA hydratase/isomerase family protein [Asanoa iriomotensis]|uniref:Enoyl-CoA hydratase n=1 Tax=Asanoa iriomotensis TaxID=234613 RepID=A0ABQ4C0S8_9ACTN|nr:enoyl-CoA hydratase/isomerase family protein [Asanoa iriomotensis]GIF56367.1 enoyl-CoA hydratase [Asanoa iriomotensis]